MLYQELTILFREDIICHRSKTVFISQELTQSQHQSRFPSTNRSSNANSEGPLVEIPGEDWRGSLGEEARRVNGLVGVRRETVVTVVHLPVRSHPRSCSYGFIVVVVVDVVVVVVVVLLLVAVRMSFRRHLTRTAGLVIPSSSLSVIWEDEEEITSIVTIPLFSGSRSAFVSQGERREASRVFLLLLRAGLGLAGDVGSRLRRPRRRRAKLELGSSGLDDLGSGVFDGSRWPVVGGRRRVLGGGGAGGARSKVT